MATVTVTPDPVSHDSTYAVTVAGLPANTTFYLYVQDPVGISVDQVGSDTTGKLSVQEYAWTAGAHTVTVTAFSGKPRRKTFAVGTFLVV